MRFRSLVRELVVSWASASPLVSMSESVKVVLLFKLSVIVLLWVVWWMLMFELTVLA